jgi:tRNA nucleotidyltransferase/poly(A) polymerase
LRQQGRVQLTGRAFGVIKFTPRRWDGPPIDIALPRTEVSTGVGHREFDVTFDHTLPIEIDLGRRDFTINAVAMELATGHLIDPFGGRRDLTDRLLRQVSDRAFPEDPLRMLRGIQLAARFHLTVETATYQAMTTHAASITTVAPERIAEELRKLFQADAPSGGFRLMRDTGLLSHILPEIDASICDGVFTRTLNHLDAIQQCEELTYRGHLDLLLAALLQSSPSPESARDRLDTLRMTMIGADLDRITALIRHSSFEIPTLETDSALRHFAYQIGPETALMVFDLRLADRLANQPGEPTHDVQSLRHRLQREIDCQVPFSVKGLAVDGHDLQQLGISPGPHMGQLLHRLLHRVLDDPSQNTRDALLTLVRQEMHTES